MKNKPLLSRVLRLFSGFLIVILILAIVGVTYQTISANSDEANFLPPGKLVDVGGYKLQIYCIGEGSPTVILDSAADMFSSDWAWIQPEIAKNTQVCSYDRAGMGWSDSSPKSRDAKQVVIELHSLLTNAGITGPYVLVGHSVAGLYVRLYASQYSDEVVGMVLIDPGHPDMDQKIPELQTQNANDANLVRTIQTLSYFGLPRLLAIGKNNAYGLPAQQAAEVNAFVSRPQHWATLSDLMKSTSATYDEVRATGTLGDMPLVVISANTAWFTKGAPTDNARTILNTLHDKIAQLSTNHLHVIVDGATHSSLVLNQNDAYQVVIAIEAVLTSIKTGQLLTK
ncbi:MAG: alpha/beta hydrolase [Caldilineaceae bacterium]|nr:alpha/beta hydrolase [Caldilineaceae bacterium]